MSRSSIRQIPWGIIVPTICLVGFGILAIDRYDKLMGLSGLFGPTARRQLIWASLGAVGFLTMLIPGSRKQITQNGQVIHPPRPFYSTGWFFYFVAVALLILVLFFDPVGGSRRWIRLGPLAMQPSEFAKLAWLILIARLLADNRRCQTVRGLLGSLLPTLVLVGLITIEPDLGTGLVILPVWLLVAWVGGAKWRHLAVLILIGLALTPVVWSRMSLEQQSRITALAQPVGPELTPTDATWQVDRARRLIALGHIGGSITGGEKLADSSIYRLPAARNDFVLCLIAERFGLLGVGTVFTLYGLLLWQGFAVARQTTDRYAQLLASGICSLFAVEMIVNTGMVVGLLPVTGLSLPLVSLGGSGLVAHLLMVGLLTNLALRSDSEPIRPYTDTDRPGQLDQ
jgi:rod shape determining protein RodA